MRRAASAQYAVPVLHADARMLHVGIALVLHIVRCRRWHTAWQSVAAIAHCMHAACRTFHATLAVDRYRHSWAQVSVELQGTLASSGPIALHARPAEPPPKPSTRSAHARTRARTYGRQDRPRERTHHRRLRRRLQRMRVDTSACDRQCAHTVSRICSRAAQRRCAQRATYNMQRPRPHGAINRGLQHVGRDVDLTERRAHRVEMEDAVFRPYGRSSAVRCRGRYHAARDTMPGATRALVLCDANSAA
jgi:hypothetical protein